MSEVGCGTSAGVIDIVEEGIGEEGHVVGADEGSEFAGGPVLAVG